MTQAPAAKHRQLGLTDERAIAMYATMLRARKFDERALLLQRSGKTAFHISGIGQEAAQAGAGFAMETMHDYFLPYYRDYALVLAAGMSVKELMMAALLRADDANGGRQMPGHFGYRELNIVTGSSPVSTQVPHAVGIALASVMNKEDRVALVAFGEGSSNQGDVHEAFNFAGLFKLPVVFFCENNQYAISIPAHRQVAGRVVDRAAGYGFPGVRVDGNDALETYRAVKEARDRAVRGAGPTLVEAVMYRLSPHSTADDDMLYRTRDEVEHHRQLDGIAAYRRYLLDCGLLDDEAEAGLAEDVAREVNEAAKAADKAPYPEPGDALKHVFADDGGGL